ncbi:hypothetical protein HanXRQr2_Chr01g0002011 [Helianthus annuus]|uniref:Uncharacterized protein n=1 Tax=Helianthus annuus TaxID=4232 RepID=A0A9K3P0S7_HELAN|nr:hypothetical protein HanXRQr2_Chr01g0002011 [Helianthus annuus]
MNQIFISILTSHAKAIRTEALFTVRHPPIVTRNLHLGFAPSHLHALDGQPELAGVQSQSPQKPARRRNHRRRSSPEPTGFLFARIIVLALLEFLQSYSYMTFSKNRNAITDHERRLNVNLIQ